MKNQIKFALAFIVLTAFAQAYAGSQPAGTITAAPATCEIPIGSSVCSTTISWATSNANNVKVLIEGHLFAAAPSGSQLAPWIGEAPAVFELWGDDHLLQTVTVVGTKATTGPTGKLTASPRTCTVDAVTGLCSVTIGWTTNKASQVQVKIAGLLFAAGLSGQSVAPWIGTNPAVFELYGDGRLLDTMTVIGQSAPTPPPPPPVDSKHCKATDAASLRACYAGLMQKKYTGVAIMNDITCSGSNACTVMFNDFKGPVKIYGNSANGSNVKLKHTDHFDEAMVTIFASDDIEFKNIDFIEGEVNKPAGLFGTPGYDRNLSCDVEPSKCNSPINVSVDATRITFDNISVLEAKSHGIVIGNANNVTIRNSRVHHAWANGILSTNGTWGNPNEHVPNNFVIENNRFTDNRCSALEISAMGASVIRGNYVSHNHMGSIYHVPGGQIAIEANTTGLLIENNEITNGKLDEDSVLAAKKDWLTVGLEFTDSHVRGVVIHHNYIHNNTGGGVIHDPNPHGPRVDFGPIKASNNVFNNVMGDFLNFSPGELIESGTCSGPQCQYVP